MVGLRLFFFSLEICEIRYIKAKANIKNQNLAKEETKIALVTDCHCIISMPTLIFCVSFSIPIRIGLANFFSFISNI